MASEAAKSSHRPFRVRYPDLGGGRNTRKDSHALNRDQLAISINTWMFASHSLSKRLGNTNGVGGISGSGAPIVGMASARFSGVTNLLIQSNANIWAAKITDTSTTSIGLVDTTAKPIQVAQMYDPVLGADTAFLVDGVDRPKTWLGPSTVLATVGSAPLNHSGSAMITPRCVATLNNCLWYAGEPTEPSGVYVSDPTLPESFTFGGQLPGASYQPYFVGYNDGISGGSITQIMPLGNAMIVYKESAIYAFEYVGFYGDIGPWAIRLLSASVGTTSPRSVVNFDTFHAFLGIDGVYKVDLTNGVSDRPISENNPDLFDGPLSAILDRTSAIGVRFGSKYLIWYDNGGSEGVPGIPNTLAPLGYPTAGAWFDFSFRDEDGYPCCGEIRDMPVNGVAPLRGAHDTGNFAWGSGSADKIGIFGSLGGDFGSNITTVFSGKSDFFDAELGDGAPETVKTVDDITIAISLFNPQPNEILTFSTSTSADLYSAFQSFARTSFENFTPSSGSIVGSAVVGTAVVAALNSAQAFQIVRSYAQNGIRGHVLQVAFQESSVFPWTTLGYSIRVSSQEAIRP